MLERLEYIGFTKYEAKAYIALLENGDLNGYELSKKAAIPKPNAYSILKSMVNKGLVYKIEEKSVRYRPRDFDEIAKKVKREMEDNLEYIKKNLPPKKSENEKFITIEGENNIVDKVKIMINNANEKVIMDLWNQDANKFMEVLKEAHNRGVKIMLIIIDGKNLDFNFEYIYNHQCNEKFDDSIERDINIVCDGIEAVSGQLGNKYCNGVYSKNKSFINVITEALSHDILLNEALKGCTKEHLENLKKIEKMFY